MPGLLLGRCAYGGSGMATTAVGKVCLWRICHCKGPAAEVCLRWYIYARAAAWRCAYGGSGTRPSSAVCFLANVHTCALNKIPEGLSLLNKDPLGKRNLLDATVHYWGPSLQKVFLDLVNLQHQPVWTLNYPSQLNVGSPRSAYEPCTKD